MRKIRILLSVNNEFIIFASYNRYNKNCNKKDIASMSELN
jgi:hypothetical protein